MCQHKTVHLRANRATLVVATLAAIALSGCSNLPTDPMGSTDSQGVGGTPKVLKAPAAMTVAAPTWNWTEVASQWVNKGEAATVSGGRSKIQLVRGALGQGATIVIMERDPLIPDVVVGPSGTALSKASTLTISYAGSAVENAPDLLKLYRFNDSTGLWAAVVATNDLAVKTFTAKVTVLGRYAVSLGDPTKAGW